MLSVSTCWRSARVRNGAQLIDALVDAGAKAVELEYRISAEMFEQMKPRLAAGVVSITSIHNFFPVPERAGFEKGSGDLFSFAAEDEAERRVAVEHGLRSIEAAAELGAKAVVFHLSKVPMPNGMDELRQFYDEGAVESAAACEFRRDFMAVRRKRAPKAFAAVMSSLDNLVTAAEKCGVTIGVENRYHPNEIPDPKEIGEILAAFDGAPIGYWHDVGHAVVQERMGVCPQSDLLEAYGERMVGIHIHDVVGHDDHWAPGTGEVDFSQVTPHVPAGALRVVEAHSKVSRQELVSSLAFVKGLGLG